MGESAEFVRFKGVDSRIAGVKGEVSRRNPEARTRNVESGRSVRGRMAEVCAMPGKMLI